MAASQQINWQKVQQTLWCVLGVVCLGAALIFWAIIDRDHWREISTPERVETELPIEAEKVAVTHHLGALHDVVKPLDMTQRVVVTAQHEPEFRGTKFIQEQRNKYSIELFRVSNEAIIKSFLKKQLQRQDFIYLRLSGSDQVEQYVLLYKTYRNSAEAKSSLEQLNLNLPKSIEPKIQSLDIYAAFVNDLGSDELSAAQKIHAVKLKPSAVPKVDEQQQAEQRAKAASQLRVEQDVATTSTTITRRDAQGNVVDVQQSNNRLHQADQGGSNAVQEITDPFN